MVGDVCGRAAADIGERSSGPAGDPRHVASWISGHGGGIELSNVAPSGLGRLVAPSSDEERRAIEHLLRNSGTAARPAVVAEVLVREFGSFAAVLNGSTPRLRRAGADEPAITALRWCRDAVLLALRRRALEQPVIGTSSALRDYLRFDMANGNRERLRTLNLNAGHELLLDEETSFGTVDSAPFYAREIIARAIEVGATSIILVHNHPSGDPRPSRRDVDATIALASLCVGVGISVLDHLIVGRDEIVSLRSMGLLGQ